MSSSAACSHRPPSTWTFPGAVAFDFARETGLGTAYVKGEPVAEAVLRAVPVIPGPQSIPVGDSIERFGVDWSAHEEKLVAIGPSSSWGSPSHWRPRRLVPLSPWRGYEADPGGGPSTCCQYR
jgi:hypothetical protein